MDEGILPAGFELLRSECNPAADEALLEALPTLESSVQLSALNLLIQRQYEPALATLVARFHLFETELQERLRARARELSVGLRSVILSGPRQARLNAIAMIVDGPCFENAFLLADALRVSCEETRSQATNGLRRLTDTLLAERSDDLTDLPSFKNRVDCLCEAMCLAIRRGVLEASPKILEWAVRLGPDVEAAILEQAADARTGVRLTVCRFLASTSDPVAAGFTIRAISEPVVAGEIVRSISQNRNRGFLRGLIDASCYLVDPRIERGCRLFRDGVWGRDVVDEVLVAAEASVARGVHLLFAAGGGRDLRAEIVSALLGSDREVVRHAALMRLVGDDTEFASRWILLVALRNAGEIGRIALEEWRRRQARLGRGRRLEPDGEPNMDDAFERCWRSCGGTNLRKRSTQKNASCNQALHHQVRVRLTSADPLDRARALRVAIELGLVDDLESSVFRLAHDADPVVRGIAVSLMGDLSNPRGLSVLQGRVEDPHPRVQAGAIDALDRLGCEGRVKWITSKLASDQPRVRAGSVRTLLRAGVLDASEALIDMLEHRSPAQRIGALWVAESLGLRSIMTRAMRMAEGDPDALVRRRASRTCRILKETSVTMRTVLSTRDPGDRRDLTQPQDFEPAHFGKDL